MTASAPSTPSADALRLRFEAFIEALCKCVAAEGVKHRIAGPLVVLIWTRLRRLGRHVSRIATRPPSHGKTQKSGKSGPRNKLPCAIGWLPRLMPATTAFAGQFRAFLADPEVQTLITADPRYGRILRPLCHTFGLRISAPLALPPRKRKPREPSTSEPHAQSPTATASRSRILPSCLEPRPDNPLWPRMPGSQFFTGLKFRT